MNIDKLKIKIIKEQINIPNAIHEILHHVDEKNFNKIFIFLLKTKNTKSYIKNTLIFPKNLYLNLYPYFENLSFEKKLLWNCNAINLFADKLNIFISLKKEFENNILLGNYLKSLEIINRIENNFGTSLWLIEHKYLLSTLMDSNCEVKVKTETDFEKLFLSYIKIKCDFNNKNRYYPETMKKYIDHYIKLTELADYLKYKLFVEKNVSNFDKILDIGCQFSIIDTYLFLLDIFQECKSLNISKSCIDNCFNLLSNVNDQFLELIIKRYNNDDSLFDSSTSIFQKISNFDNEYESVYNEINENIELYVQSFYAYKLVSICQMELNIIDENKNNIYKNLLYFIKTMLEKRDTVNVVNSIGNLSTYIRILSSFSISNGLLNFLNNFLDVNVWSQNALTVSSLFDLNLFYAISATNSMLLFPERNNVVDIDSEAEKEYMNWYKTKNFTTNDIMYYYYYEAYLSLEIKNYIKDNQHRKALKKLFCAYIENIILVFSINIDEFKSYIQEKTNNSEDLYLEEVCYMHLDSSFKEQLPNAFLNLLDSETYPCSDPLEFIMSYDSEKEIKEYFLYNVCNIELLNKIYWMDNESEAKLNYRIKICENLLESKSYIDAKTLNQEIEELTTKNVTKNRLQKIDSSRVTINWDKISDEVSDKISELIHRYNTTSEDEKYLVIYNRDNPKLSAYSNARSFIISEICYSYIEAFYISENGIDTSLSTRVRHGAFTNHIINVLDNCHFFNIYDLKNPFNKLVNNTSYGDYAKKLIEETVKAITDEIEYAKTHSLKVTFSDHIEGAIFDYSLTSVEEDDLEKKLRYFHPLSLEKVSSVFNTFLINKSNRYLKEVREELLPDISKKISSILDSLNNDLSLLLKKDKQTYIKINRIIVNCKTDIQKEIENMKLWFYLSAYNAWEDYNFKELLEISNEINKKMFTNYEAIDIKSDFEEITVKGYTFRNLVDIYSILFNNAITHSGFQKDLSKLKIEIKIFSNKNSVHLVFSNNIHSNIDKEEIDNKINELNQVFETQEYRAINSRQEGGMGLYKVMHILFLSNSYGQSIIFYRNDNSFNVDIQFSKEIIRNEELTSC